MPTTPAHKDKSSPTKRGAAPRKGRVSAEMRKAVSLIVRNAISQRDAAKIVGIHESTLSTNLKKPHVQALVKKEQDDIILQAGRLAAVASAHATMVGIELLHKAKSEAVRARMVELFRERPEATNPTVAVQINNTADKAMGYAYARPLSDDPDRLDA